MTNQQNLSPEELKQAVVDFFLKMTGGTIGPDQVQFEKHKPGPLQQTGTPDQFTATIYLK